MLASLHCLRPLLYLAAFCSPAASQAATWPVPSVWELIEVSPVTMLDSNPRGMSNRREYYTPDGLLCILDPAETTGESSDCIKVALTKDRRVVTTPDGEKYVAEILAFTPERATLAFPDGSTFEYRRLPDDAAVHPIRPHSLHVLKAQSGQQLRAQDVRYVERARGDVPASLIGVWEAIEFRDFPYADLPPYGFPNLKWVFGVDYVAQISPTATVVSKDERSAYKLASSQLSVPALDRVFTVSFDRWGDLVLASTRGTVTLRQLSTDPHEIPAIPEKVAVLVLGDQ
jgi:hypothetical protein